MKKAKEKEPTEISCLIAYIQGYEKGRSSMVKFFEGQVGAMILMGEFSDDPSRFDEIIEKIQEIHSSMMFQLTEN